MLCAVRWFAVSSRRCSACCGCLRMKQSTRAKGSRGHIGGAAPNLTHEVGQDRWLEVEAVWRCREGGDEAEDLMSTGGGPRYDAPH